MTHNSEFSNEQNETSHKRGLAVCIALSDDGWSDSEFELLPFLQMATELNDSGHRVDFLLFNPRSANQEQTQETSRVMSWVRDAGFRVFRFENPLVMPNTSENGLAAELPYLAYEALKARRYDVVHFRDYGAAAYYYILACKEGLIESPAATVIHVERPLVFRLLSGQPPSKDYSIPAKCYMERWCIENADAVYLHSKEVSGRLQTLNYRLPANRTKKAPLPTEFHLRTRPKRQKRSSSSRSVIDELLYASPISQGEGFTTFVYALDVLSSRGVTPKRVTIVGAVVDDFPFVEFLEKHKENWPFELDIIVGGSPAAVQAKVEDPSVLTVFPGFHAVSPYLAHVVISAGRPLLATETEDLLEFIPEELMGEFFVVPHHLVWADRIQEVLENGIRNPGCERPFSPNWWVNEHKKFGAASAMTERVFSRELQARFIPDSPMVSACIAHFNRPHSIESVLKSLEAQTFQDFEIIVIDDGSRDEALQELERLLVDNPKARLIRQDNRYLGAARNTGARHARGKYLLFLDDDNYADRKELETFVRVAEHTGADILTCFSDLFVGEGDPGPENTLPTRRMPFGPDLTYGLLRNGFGDSNSFVRRGAWEELGGFTEHYRIGLDDHEFFARAVMSGFTLMVIPESLYYYRLADEPMKKAHVNRSADFLRVLDPYLDHKRLDPDLLPLIFAARSAFNLR